MEEKYNNEIEILKKYRQDEILEIIKNFSDEEKEDIFNQISKINFEEIDELYKLTKKEEEKNEALIEPIDAIDKLKLSDEELNNFEKLGLDAIKEGKYAVVTMAGGQRNKTWT